MPVVMGWFGHRQTLVFCILACAPACGRVGFEALDLRENADASMPHGGTALGSGREPGSSGLEASGDDAGVASEAEPESEAPDGSSPTPSPASDSALPLAPGPANAGADAGGEPSESDVDGTSGGASAMGGSAATTLGGSAAAGGPAGTTHGGEGGTSPGGADSAAGGSSSAGAGSGGTGSGGMSSAGGGMSSSGAGGSPAGSGGGGASAGSGPTNLCVPTNGGLESCDGLDDDCNGEFDENGCPPTCRGVEYAGAGYMLCDSMISWDEAVAACAAENLLLATVETAEKNQILVDLMYPADGSQDLSYSWLGLRRADSSSPWVWADGSPLEGYTNWNGGSPSTAGVANCVQMDSSGEWFASRCDFVKRFVCELQP